ncbi:MAG TPA: DNA-formamidopyrimidine glycosylase family protein, partial [Myxococcota bacterium]
MPELPEVEIIARRLRDGNKREQKIVGRTIVDVAVPSPKVVKQPSRAAFIKALTGARVTAVRRRAKHLVIETSAGALLVHLRLTGDLHVVPDLADAALKFVRAGLVFAGGHALAFTDGRHLGEIRLLD